MRLVSAAVAVLAVQQAVAARRVVRQAEGTEVCATCNCGALELPGYEAPGCGSLAVGESCEVSCPAGHIGLPVRYYCFSDQALKGLPPVGLRPPLCRAPGPLFGEKEKLSLSWDGNGCLSCTKGNSKCEVLADVADTADERCTQFTLELDTTRIRAPNGQCVDSFGGPHPGLWGCNGGQHQKFLVDEGSVGSSGRICCRSGRGTICLHRVGDRGQLDPRGALPPLSLLEPALKSLAAGQAGGFLKHAQAVQQCKAKLESGAPDSFWAWLKRQDPSMRKALFSTFPAHPGQTSLLRELVETVGEETFDSLGMGPFGVAVSHTNRWKQGDEIVTHPHNSFEINGYRYVKGQEAEARQAMIDGQHSGIQSNECNNLHRCCGEPDTWKFKWPRDPNPTVKEWVQWWVSTVQRRGDKLWQNPLNNTPWMFGAHLWPSPIEECEWVHRKVMDSEEMEGRWYLYDSSFHNRICAGGKYHPDSLPGIAVYGGVCGRMAQLEWRKTSCMGMPSTQKGEPGHCAGFKFRPRTGQYGPLTTDSGVAAPADSCLRCVTTNGACTYEPAGSPNCTEFNFDAEERLIRAPNGQCVDVHAGPRLGLWGCTKGRNQLADLQEDGTPIIRSPRATVTLKPPAASAFGITAVAGIELPPGYCLRCPRHWGPCEHVPATNKDCTKFTVASVGENAHLKMVGSNQCVDIFPGPQFGIYGCSADNTNQVLETKDDGSFVIRSKRATTTVVKTRGPMPPVMTRWDFEGFHSISCTKSNCHWPSVLTLDSGAEAASTGRHAEAAMATIDAWNSYETKGIWPTAYDESRLAASMAHTLLKRYGSEGKEHASGLLAWALRRNPGLYEAWELAAELPAAAEGAAPTELELLQANDREGLATRKWFQSLSLVELEAGSEARRAHAERFAEEHLLAKHMQSHWEKYPILRERLTSRLCGSLSDGTLEALGPASSTCRHLRKLAAGDGKRWQALSDDLLSHEGHGPETGNVPCDKFQEAWELLARLVVAGEQSEKATDLVKSMVSTLSVGFVSSRSQAFFAEHGRVVLRGPYAMALQLAGILLTEAERNALLDQTKLILENPSEYQDRLFSSSGDRALNKFIAWVNRRTSSASKTVNEAASVIDNVNGLSVDDEANDEVMDEMVADRDTEMELGAKFWDEDAMDAPEDQRFDVTGILRHLLRVGAEVDADSQDDFLEQLEDAAGEVPALVQLGVQDEQEAARAADVAFSSCVKDLLRSVNEDYWG